MTSPKANTPKAPIAPRTELPSPVLILLKSSPSSSKESTPPRPVLGGVSFATIASSQISSLTHTIRPSPSHSYQPSRQSTIKCLNPNDLTYPLSLANLSLHHLVPSSLGTAKPQSRLYLDLERIKVDELDVEVCLWCRAQKDQEEMELKEIAEWGLQWVCKGCCQSVLDRGDSCRRDKEAEAERRTAEDAR